MAIQEEINNIEIRSEELDSILGKAPGVLVRYGLGLVFGFVAVLVIGSFFFKYPDAIQSPVEITTLNPPAGMIARADGKITHLFVTNGLFVRKNTILASIENPADFYQVQQLGTLLDTIKKAILLRNTASLEKLRFDSFNQLGDIQPSFTLFTKALADVIRYYQVNYHQKKIDAVTKQIKMTRLYYDRLYTQKQLVEKDLKLGNTQYARDSVLFKNKVIALAEFEKSGSAQLQKQQSLESARLSLAQSQIGITQLEEQVLELQLQAEEQQKTLFLALDENYKTLLSQISTWEKRYLLRTPIDGKVTYTKFWSENQDVKTGETVLTVIPEKKTEVVGKLTLQIQGSGKVKAGQKVNIRFDNYPYMEYGMLQARIRSISLATENNAYTAELELPDGLKTNYKITLPYSNGMKGNAEIITEDLSLFQRFFNPVKALFKRRF